MQSRDNPGRRGEMNISKVCYGHGKCVVGEKCECDDGWSGRRCEFRTCHSGCLANGGTCDPISGSLHKVSTENSVIRHVISLIVAKTQMILMEIHAMEMVYVITKLGCTCNIDGEPDANRCKDKYGTCQDHICEGKCNALRTEI